MTTIQKVIIGVVVAVVLGLFVLGVVMGVAVVGWKASVRSGNEAAALQDLKTIAAVEAQYFNTHNRNFGTFDQMIKEGMLDSRFAGDLPLVDGYIFNLKVIPGTTNAPASYRLSADPQSNDTGKNHFYLDSTGGTIHVNVDQPATANDPPMGG
jgi:Tfp pilus assembly protein PilE